MSKGARMRTCHRTASPLVLCPHPPVLTRLWIVVVPVVEQDSVEGHCAWFRPGQAQGS